MVAVSWSVCIHFRGAGRFRAAGTERLAGVWCPSGRTSVIKARKLEYH